MWQRIRGELFPLLWLAYLIVPIYELIQIPIVEAWFGYLFLAVFIVVYRLTYSGLVWRQAFFIIQIIVIDVLLFHYGGSFWFMYLYPLALSGNIKKPYMTYILFGLSILSLIGFFVVKNYAVDWKTVVFSLPYIILGIAIPFAIRWQNQYNQVQSELATANEQLIIKEERERIARDLHDTLGHTLSMLSMKSDLAAKLIDRDPSRAKEEMADIHQTVRAALKEVRPIVSTMKTTTWEEELAAAKKLIETAGMTFTFEPNGAMHLSPLKENILGMCLREAVNNVVKHSGAGHCTIRLYCSETQAVLSVSDDGACPREATKESGGTGLKGLQVRLALIEGELDFKKTSAGARLEIVIPAS
ncbi:sensor histidine kinase [Camelliibacillus cellulosilyticus]|uniref:histidine kinase n=1 Tax=Camelliibacillus cellulosilyticus TaxID=2174486 RepID=A0ABV9GJX4_9BACL